MKGDYSYTLASNRVPKLDCPFCGAKKHWQRYYNPLTGDVLPSKYGRCDNEDRCDQHLNPYSDGYFKLKNVNKLEKQYRDYRGTGLMKQTPPTQKIEPALIPHDVFNQTLKGYEQNVFIQNLLQRIAYPFAKTDIEKVIALYYLGTVCNGYRTGAITFPYIDITDGVRAIQVKEFDQTNHTVSTDFLHSIIEKHHVSRNQSLPGWLEAYNKQDKRVSCLFGEHLLSKYPMAPVALVEAPKTAIYSTLYFGFPECLNNFIWLAVYNKSSFTLDKIKVLKGRDVYVFPDLSKDGKTFNEWKQKAKSFEEQLPGTKFILYDFLERVAPDELKKAGADLADVLINMDWRQIRKNYTSIQTISRIEEEQNSGEAINCEKCEKYEPREKTFLLQNEVLPSEQCVCEKLNANGGLVQSEREKQITTDASAKINTSTISDQKESQCQTFGQLFDLMKARGYKELPCNMSILIQGIND